MFPSSALTCFKKKLKNCYYTVIIFGITSSITPWSSLRDGVLIFGKIEKQEEGSYTNITNYMCDLSES